MELLPLKISSQEVRYFVEEYNNMETLEASLDNSPGDVALWIKLARLQLHQNNDDITSDDADSYQDNVSQALSTLSRGLEENTHSEVRALPISMQWCTVSFYYYFLPYSLFIH